MPGPRRLVVARRALVAAIGLALGAVAFAPAAAAQEGQSIGGTLEIIGPDQREPVGGVEMSVSLDGEDIGTAVTAPDGTWVVAVPAAGIYTVTLDTGTLPDGVGLTDPARTTLDEVSVRDGQQKTVRFPLGEGIVVDQDTLSRLTDLTVLGLKLGAIIALAAVGLSLVFGVTGLVNFAHGELLTLGAVLAFLFHSSGAGPGWALVVAAIPAVALTAAFGGAQEILLWRPLRRRRTGPIAMLVISIGLSFAIRNVILIVFSGQPRTYEDYAIQDEVSFLGISTVPKNIVIVGAAVIILGAVGLFLQRTQTGIAMRAVADNNDLAESSGIDVNRVILVTWVMGAGLAGLGGIFLGVTEQVQWDMGFRVLLLIFAAVVLGGLGTAFGAMLGGFVIGVAVEVSTYWIDSELKNAVALAVLIAMLIWRPQGLLGVKERIG